MNYEEIEIETLAGVQKQIVIINEDGSGKSFPADENNPEFIAFQKALKETN